MLISILPGWGVPPGRIASFSRHPSGNTWNNLVIYDINNIIYSV
jgi:hypothetical protein